MSPVQEAQSHVQYRPEPMARLLPQAEGRRCWWPYVVAAPSEAIFFDSLA
jgi:hypothetical protein